MLISYLILIAVLAACYWIYSRFSKAAPSTELPRESKRRYWTRVLIYVLLGPLLGLATVLLVTWPQQASPPSVWQVITSPKSWIIPYGLGIPISLLVAIIDYELRNYRWQWICVVAGAGLLCMAFCVVRGFWFVGVVPAGICSFLSNFPRNRAETIQKPIAHTEA